MRIGEQPWPPPYLNEIAAAFRNAPPLRSEDDRDRALKCPVCSADMAIERVHGVRIDACRAHGAWFDLGEVPQLIERVRAGEALAASAAVRDARRDGKISGMLFGLLSLFFDRHG